MKRKLLIALFAAISLTGQGQEDVWQKCNESLPEDIRINPTSCFANTEATGEFIQLTQDNNIKTLYHSKHGNEKFEVSPENPAELTFDFNEVRRIDYLEYVPRQYGKNGTVNEAEIYVKTAADIAFVPSQKVGFWKEKIEEVKSLDWSKEELLHIQEVEN